MKKKILLIMIIMLVTLSLRAQAATYEGHLPGGKNYLDKENFHLYYGSIETVNPFKVLPGQTYTLSFPGSTTLSEVMITVSGKGGYSYFDDVVTNINDCTTTSERTTCTFTTRSTEEYLSIRVLASSGTEYYTNYGINHFQLEEGGGYTSYEEYIAPTVDVGTPTFVDNGTFLTSYTEQLRIEDIISNHITVIDEIDGNISDQIVIEDDNYTMNNDIVGQHIVLLSATDASGNRTEFELTIMVKDDIVPVITGPSAIDVSVDDQLTLSTIIEENFIFNDHYDGALNYEVTSDTYSSNKATLGTYSVTVKTQDAANNLTEHTFTIAVKDDQAPTITGLNTLNSYMSDLLSIDDIIASQVVGDNYSNMTSTDVVIVEDNYSGYESVPGQYTVRLALEDSTSNRTEKSIVITVIDDILPVITGPATYTDSYQSLISVADLSNLLTLTDNVDTILLEDMVIIEDTLTTRATQVGTFIVSFEIRDTAGNTNTHTIEITLVDDIPPVIYVDEYIITLSNEVTFGKDDALRLLLSNNELNPGDYQVSTLYDEYTGHESEAGTYVYRLSFTSEEGEVLEKEFVIRVTQEESSLTNFFSLRRIVLFSASFLLIGLTIYKAKK